MARDPLEKELVGPAGEHYILYRLFLKGFLAAFTPPGLRQYDILVLTPSRDGSSEDVAATVQVKTITRGNGWPMQRKHEDVYSERFFYAFVGLRVDPPDVYLVPSRVVADVLRRSHQTWLDTPGRGGRSHVDNPMRRLRPHYEFPVDGYPPGWLEQYREAWESLKP